LNIANILKLLISISHKICLLKVVENVNNVIHLPKKVIPFPNHGKIPRYCQIRRSHLKAKLIIKSKKENKNKKITVLSIKKQIEVSDV